MTLYSCRYNVASCRAKKHSINSVLINLIRYNLPDRYDCPTGLLPDNYNDIWRSLGVCLADYIIACLTMEFGKLVFSGDRNKS